MIFYRCIVVVSRPQIEGGIFEAELASEWYARRIEDTSKLRGQAAGLILPVTVTSLDISGTAVRALIQKGLSAQYLVPDKVLEFINQHGLYR